MEKSWDLTPQQYADHRERMEAFRQQNFVEPTGPDLDEVLSIEQSEPMILYYDGPMFAPEAVR